MWRRDASHSSTSQLPNVLDEGTVRVETTGRGRHYGRSAWLCHRLIHSRNNREARKASPSVVQQRSLYLAFRCLSAIPLSKCQIYFHDSRRSGSGALDHLSSGDHFRFWPFQLSTVSQKMELCNELYGTFCAILFHIWWFTNCFLFFSILNVPN